MRLTPLAARAPALTLAALTLAALAGCGAKTGLVEHERVPPPPECMADADCDDGLYCTGVEACREGRCIGGAPVVCTDGDECTDDECIEATRACQHRPVSRDADGDGFNAPRRGYTAGQPGACGNDCDDANPAVHPGATEVCNGVDDNCNGVVDDNATFAPADPDVRVSDPATAPSGPAGVAWSGERYLTSYWGYTTGTSHVYYSAIDREGVPRSTPPQIRLTLTPSDSYGAAVAWNPLERVLGIAWQDRRDGDYEIYFNRLTPDGEKLGPDQRVTFTPGFSVNPSIAFTGEGWVIVWQDERDTPGTGAYEIYAQRVDRMGRQLEDNVRLTRDPANSESPVIAASGFGTAVAWLDGRGGSLGMPTTSRGIWFATFDNAMVRQSPDERVSAAGQNTVAPTTAWNRDRWVVAWHDAAPDSPDHEVWGATRNANGHEVTAARRLTNDPGFSRYPSLVPLGDRVLAVWADDRDGAGYELYARMFDTQLAPLSAEARVTHAPRDSVYPIATLGPEGDVGILFRDQRDGGWAVRFTRLRCAIPR